MCSATNSQVRKFEISIISAEVQTQESGYVTFVTISTAKSTEKFITVPSQNSVLFNGII